MRAGSTSRITTERQPWNIPTSDHPDPAMWNMGMAQRFTESLWNLQGPPILSSRPKKFSLVIMAPLGNPVVPDV